MECIKKWEVRQNSPLCLDTFAKKVSSFLLLSFYFVFSLILLYIYYLKVIICCMQLFIICYFFFFSQQSFGSVVNCFAFIYFKTPFTINNPYSSSSDMHKSKYLQNIQHLLHFLCCCTFLLNPFIQYFILFNTFIQLNPYF